jgi:hypothetical protein
MSLHTWFGVLLLLFGDVPGAPGPQGRNLGVVSYYAKNWSATILTGQLYKKVLFQKKS